MNEFLRETRRVLKRVDQAEIDAVLTELRDVKARGGRLFFVGNGGGAGHASHATCDFRKVAGFEAYCVNDNVSELTARINDDAWESCYIDSLIASRFWFCDTLFVFSVGGGGGGVSENIARASDHAARVGGLAGITGVEGGAVAVNSNACIRIPSDSTPIVEGIQAVLWHHLVTELAC